MTRLARLVIGLPDGSRLEVAGRLAEIDLTGVPNADARAPLMVRIEFKCDLGDWHVVEDAPLPFYPNEHDLPAPG